ncbi:response regulator [Erythrobacter litoralis]|uniref:response regulator n=1 Tax=Erythrobacter litoralis TaxID=39960 RepID=UPI002435BB6B|nr:response regulator [Erythrobacter litoralis]MDG6078975.1 response regulator [Erythrobacter litoralis]
MPSRKEKIFVVEDEVLIAFEMCDMLEDLGFEIVGPSVHLQDAEARAKSDEMDAAFLDVNLGGGDTSKPVAEVLRERGVPFVFITAYDRDEITFVLPNEKIVRKPITNGKLYETLQAVLPDVELKSSAE